MKNSIVFLFLNLFHDSTCVTHSSSIPHRSQYQKKFIHHPTINLFSSETTRANTAMIKTHLRTWLFAGFLQLSDNQLLASAQPQEARQNPEKNPTKNKTSLPEYDATASLLDHNYHNYLSPKDTGWLHNQIVEQIHDTILESGQPNYSSEFSRVVIEEMVASFCNHSDWNHEDRQKKKQLREFCTERYDIQ